MEGAQALLLAGYWPAEVDAFFTAMLKHPYNADADLWLQSH